MKSRDLLSASAVQQYLDFVDHKNPVRAPKLDRFDADLWHNSLLKVTINSPDFSEGDELNEDHVEEIQHKGDYWARDAERGSLIDYAKRDKRVDRWARVDPQPPSCPFCTVLISRGAFYKSKDSAGVAETAKFHTGCTCTVILVKAGEKDSFDGVEHRDAALEEYQAAARLAGSTDIKDIVQAIRHIRGS